MNNAEIRAEETVRAYGEDNFITLVKRMIDEGLEVIMADDEISPELKEAVDIVAMHMKDSLTE